MNYTIITNSSDFFHDAINYFKIKKLYSRYIITDYCDISLKKNNLTTNNSIENNSDSIIWIVKYKDTYFKCIYDKKTNTIEIILSAKYYTVFIDKFFNCPIKEYQYKYLY